MKRNFLTFPGWDKQAVSTTDTIPTIPMKALVRRSELNSP